MRGISDRVLLAALLFATIALAACEGMGGVYYTRVASLRPLAPAESRLSFFRERRDGDLGVAQVTLDGSPTGIISAGTVLVVQHAEGDIQITIEPAVTGILSNGPKGHLSFPLKAEGGREYYIQFTAAAQAPITGGAISYLQAIDVVHLTQYCDGGWCADILDKDTAFPRMRTLFIATQD